MTSTPEQIQEIAKSSTSLGPFFGSVPMPAEHPYAVLYQGPWETLEDGVGRAVRMHARALAGTGIPVLLKSVTYTVRKNGLVLPVYDPSAALSPTVLEQVGELHHTSCRTLFPMVRHVVITSPGSLRQLLVPKSLSLGDDLQDMVRVQNDVMRSNVVFSVWERDRVSPEVVQILNRVGQNWVPCWQNRNMLVKSGVDPDRIEVMGHPFDVTSRLAVDGPRRTPVLEKRFLSIGAWQPRKGMHELLGAFLRAFEPGEAKLTIKTTPTQWQGYPSPQDSVRFWLEDSHVRLNYWTLEALKGNVRIIVSDKKESEIEDLHLEHNIYVSASHGEGFGWPAFDSKVAGNRMVHVPYGGTQDFCTPDDVEVPCRMGLVDPEYRWEEDAEWAVYWLEDLQNALLRVEPPQTHQRSASFDARYTMESVGTRMGLSLLTLAHDLSRSAYDYLESKVLEFKAR